MSFLVSVGVYVLFLLTAVTGCTASGGPTATDRPTASTLGAESPSPTPSAGESATTLQFVLGDQVRIGQTVDLRLRNLDDRAYSYRYDYAACELTYTDADGREFLIPPGTHCDLVSDATIKPGQTVTLFKWKLNECVKDRWGCVKSEPLPPGDYTITGNFKALDKSRAVEVSTTFNLASA